MRIGLPIVLTAASASELQREGLQLTGNVAYTSLQSWRSRALGWLLAALPAGEWAWPLVVQHESLSRFRLMMPGREVALELASLVGPSEATESVRQDAWDGGAAVFGSLVAPPSEDWVALYVESADEASMYDAILTWLSLPAARDLLAVAMRVFAVSPVSVVQLSSPFTVLR